jgi:hypothetical protein
VADLKGVVRVGRALATGALPVGHLRAQLDRAPLEPATPGGPVGLTASWSGSPLLRQGLGAQAANWPRWGHRRGQHLFPGYPLLIQAGSSLTGLSPRLVGLCLLALVRERWLVAGVGALAGLVRPTGLVAWLGP